MGIREIVGDDNQIYVRYQGTGDQDKHILIFRVRRNEEDLTSISSRSVAYFNKEPVDSEDYTFDDRATMRAVLRDAIHQAWVPCLQAAEHPDSIVELDVDAYGHAFWEVKHESELYQKYLSELSPLAHILPETHPEQVFELTEKVDLVSMHPTTSGFTSELVRKAEGPESRPLFVCQRLRFLDALQCWTLFTDRRDLLYSTIRRLHCMPPHENILSPPSHFLTESNLIVGIFYQHLSTLDTARPPALISLSQKASWFEQLTSALLHAHIHGEHPLNLHPGTILLPDPTILVIADWSNSSAYGNTQAPEADGTWVLAGPDPTKGTMIYTPYTGTPRRNLPCWPGWNSYPEWARQRPRAAEAAIVFAAARTIWIVLSGDEGSLDWDLLPDLPVMWRTVLEMCLRENPNARMRLPELMAFWGREVERLKD